MLIFLVFTLAFLVLSVVAQGYKLFHERYRELEVVAIQKTEEPSPDWIFLLNGYVQDGTGLLVEIRRPLEDVEVPFAVVRVTGVTSKGLYQAVPIWFAAGHLRDFTARRFSPNVLIASPYMYFENTQKAFSELNAREVANGL